VDKDGDLKNGLRIEMDKLNMVVMKEVVEEIAGREFKSSLKKGYQHHNFLSMRSGDYFILCWQRPLSTRSLFS
jgi:hypothetical protein